MRNMNRALAVGLTLGFATHLLTGDSAPNPRSAAEEAAVARLAVAQRYGSCAITGVNDHHVAKLGLYPNAPSHTRDVVDVSVHVTETPEALYYEKKYDKDGSVMWMPVHLMARERVPGRSGTAALGTTIPGPLALGSAGHATEITQPIYPFADRTSGNVGIFVGESTETIDYDGLKDYRVYGAKYCGTIVLKTLEDGSREWQVDAQAPPMDDILIERECDLEPDSTQPSVFYSQC